MTTPDENEKPQGENEKPQGEPTSKKPTEAKSNGKSASSKDPMAQVALYMQEERYQTAAQILEQAIKDDPDDGSLKHNYAVVLFELKEYEQAEKLFWEAFEEEKKTESINWATMW